MYRKNPIQRNDKVRIKKGAKIHSLHPKYKSTNGYYTAGRSYVITVHHSLDGYPPPDAKTPGKNDSVCWAGVGGYWCQTDNINVEKIEQ